MKRYIFHESVPFADIIKQLICCLTSSCFTDVHFLMTLYFTNFGIIRFSEKIVNILTFDFSLQVCN